MFKKEIRKAIDDTKRFIVSNTFDEDLNQKKWFININYKERFIRLHPQGGKIDLQNNVSKRYKNHYRKELEDLRTGKTIWYGLFNNMEEAGGFALYLAKTFRKQTGKGLRIDGCNDDIVPHPLNSLEERRSDDL